MNFKAVADLPEPAHMISILVLTKNEERDLPGCLSSVAWSDDLHVFDSFSDDATTTIAENAGAKVTRRRFDGYASQRNAALHGLRFKHPWVLIIDADERIPASSAEEMKSFVSTATDDISAARLRRRDFLFGAWLKHAQISPYYVRLVRPTKVCYEREVNEVLRIEGEIAELSEPFDHFPFSKGMHHWLDKHNTYSDMEARLITDAQTTALAEPICWRKALFASDFNERRAHQKSIFYRMPMRPLIKWLYMVGIRRAFLDGRAGMTYAWLQCFYEYMIVLKTREHLELAKTRPVDSRAARTDNEPIRVQ